MSVEKVTLRAVIRSRLRTLAQDKALAAEKSRLAARALLESGFYRESSAVLAFLSFGTEIQTHELVKQMLSDGRHVAVPRTYESDGEDGRMDFFWLSADKPLEEQVEKGDFGILVPQLSLEKVDEAALPEKTLIVLPGVAFSKNGWRLGQGRGFYDRFLERALKHRPEPDSGKPVLAGYCFALQLLEDVPHDEWDVPVDFIVTENGIARVL